MAAARASGVPYLFIAGHEPEPEYRAWLQEKLPRVSIAVWPAAATSPTLRTRAGSPGAWPKPDS
jgi:hypothetical protein